MGFMGYDGGFMAFLVFLMSYDFLDDFLYVIQWFFLWYDGVWCDTGVISHDMEGFLYGLMGFLCDTTFFNVIQCVFDVLPRVFSPMWVCPEEIQAVDNRNLQHLHLCSLSLIEFLHIQTATKQFKLPSFTNVTQHWGVPPIRCLTLPKAAQSPEIPGSHITWNSFNSHMSHYCSS